MEKALKVWSEKGTPGVFAVTPDGSSYGYSYCNDIRCSGDDETVALYSCESKNPGKRCLIYARGGKYVWNKEQIDFSKSLPRSDAERTATAQGIRPMAFTWEGYTALMSGIMEFKEHGRTGAIELVMTDQTKCRGYYSFTEEKMNKNKGSWFLRCENGLGADGTFETTGSNGGVVATGKDDRNRSVSAIVGGKA
ncbi:hypothetical protein JL100_020050 [Skermanella mucosa]|uniref:hypothetical protein n=1 Tax=Skermanella mucosa TaxID=1789672 RepID=UPI00192B2582|nr:hypothetical protein [Skermanella mucosa]UEM19369.1 hypothetical protein JL100_020050 [Skermanella mucosa]